MMRKAIGTTIAVIWIIAGVAGSWYVYDRTSVFNQKAVVRDLHNLSARLTGDADSAGWLRELPLLFRDHTFLHAMFLTGSRNELIGSLYEDGRISRDEYTSFLAAFRGTSGPEGQIAPGSLLLRFPLPGNRTLHMVGKRKLSVAETMADVRHRYPDWPAAIAIFALGLFAVGVIFFTPKNITSPTPAGSLPVKHPAPMKQDNNLTRLSLTPGSSAALRNLFAGCKALEMDFYSLRYDRVEAEVRLRGALLIWGEGDRAAADWLSSRRGGFEPLYDAANHVWLMPVADRQGTFAAIRLRYGNAAGTPSTEVLKDIIQAHVPALRVLVALQSAVRDPETGLPTYASFYYDLREKLSQQKETVVILLRVNVSGDRGTILASLRSKWSAEPYLLSAYVLAWITQGEHSESEADKLRHPGVSIVSMVFPRGENIESVLNDLERSANRMVSTPSSSYTNLAAPRSILPGRT